MTQDIQPSESMSARMWLLCVALLAAAAVRTREAWGYFPNIDCNQVGDPGYHRPLGIGDYLVVASIARALGGSALFAVGQWRTGHPVRGLLLALIPVPVVLAFAALWEVVGAYGTFHCS